MKLNKKQVSKRERVLLTFLKRTKAGRYTKIQPDSLEYARMRTLREEAYPEQEAYLYSTK
jgi:hypothetical protein